MLVYIYSFKNEIKNNEKFCKSFGESVLVKEYGAYNVEKYKYKSRSNKLFKICRKSLYVQNIWIKLDFENVLDNNLIINSYFNFVFNYRKSKDSCCKCIKISMLVMLLYVYLNNEDKDVNLNKLKFNLLDIFKLYHPSSKFYYPEKMLLDIEFCCEYSVEYDIGIDYSVRKEWDYKLCEDSYKVKYSYIYEKSSFDCCLNKKSRVNFRFCSYFLIILGKCGESLDISEVILYCDDKVFVFGDGSGLIRCEIFGVEFWVVSLSGEIYELDDLKKVLINKNYLWDGIDFLLYDKVWIEIRSVDKGLVNVFDYGYGKIEIGGDGEVGFE